MFLVIERYVCYWCVNCSIKECLLLYFVSDTVYVKLQYVYVVCSGVCSIVGRGVRGGCLEEGAVVIGLEKG